jgi:hypothetical protein
MDDDATIKKHALNAFPGLKTYPMAYRVPLPTDPKILALKETDLAAFMAWSAEESERLYRQRMKDAKDNGS